MMIQSDELIFFRGVGQPPMRNPSLRLWGSAPGPNAQILVGLGPRQRYCDFTGYYLFLSWFYDDFIGYYLFLSWFYDDFIGYYLCFSWFYDDFIGYYLFLSWFYDDFIGYYLCFSWFYDDFIGYYLFLSWFYDDFIGYYSPHLCVRFLFLVLHSRLAPPLRRLSAFMMIL